MFDEKGVEHNRWHCFIPEKDRLKKAIYMCDKKFHIDTVLPCFPAKHLDENQFGVIVMHGEEASVYTTNLVDYKCLDKLTVALPNAHNNGGQSQNRYQRLRAEAIREWLKKVLSVVRKHFECNGVACVQSLAIVGTGGKRFELEKMLPSHLKNIVYKNVSIPSVKTEMEEILRIVQFQDYIVQEETSLCKRIIEMIKVEPDMMVFGTKKAMTKHLVNGFLRELVVHKDMFTKDEQLLSIASQVGCTVHIISSHCPESSVILNGYGGIIGIKWF